MRPIKGIQLDNRPSEQPDETYPFGKNGVQFDLNGTVFNEPGFRKLAAVVPYVLNGVIETDDNPILFSTNNVNSAIGFFNKTTELYEPILDDRTWTLTGKYLGFKVENYITGESQRNYKGEVTCTFTDKVLFPMFLNCTNPSLSSIDDLRLFAYFTPPNLTITQALGGKLLPGTYYVAVGYEKNDGTSAPYSSPSSGVLITPDATLGVTSKSLSIVIDNADTNYDQVRIAIISRIDGKTTAVELNDFFPITGAQIQLIYTGVNPSTDIAIESILTPPALYKKVGTLGQLNDALYLGELEKEPDLDDMQPYAASVIIEWQSELMDALNPPVEHVTGIKKSRMHEEVYAIYIRYRKTRGGTTKWYIVPGQVPLTADLAASTEATVSGYTGGTVPVFKVEDTIHYFDPVAKTGACGVWQNATERYPDYATFDATSIGGPNLRGALVRHHKMPSLRWCKANLYKTEDDYGKTKLDMLGLKAVNVRIPDKYIGIINGYEIGYALRTTGNMTVQGQSVLMHGVTDTRNYHKALSVIPIYTSGGNFTSAIFHPTTNFFSSNRGPWNDDDALQDLRTDTMRFHAFDLLFNTPAIRPDFISAQFKLHRDLSSAEYLEDGTIDDTAPNGPIVFLIDYTRGLKPIQIPTGKKLRAIKNSFYLNNTVNVNQFVNLRHESTFAGTLLGTDWGISNGNSSLRTRRGNATDYTLGMPGFEETYLINLLSIKTDIYDNFYSQLLVSAGSAKALTDTSTFWGGDTFNCDYTFHTYGRHDAVDSNGDGYQGKKIVRRIVCESISNIAVRYEIPANIYSKWYPHNSLTPGVPEQCYPTLQLRDKDPNQFGYSKDFNALNDLIDSTIFSPFAEYIYTFPYRIHRGGKNNRQTRPRSWRTFLALDYYECQKNMGRIIKLVGMDDRLLIHHENALFITQDKAKLNADAVLSITLGAGDIFQFEPQEAISSKLGYAGTQHDLACIVTPMGYFFTDAKQGEVYLHKQKPQNINPGVNTFLREFLKITDKNVYIGNGITVAWDQKYKRLLLTVKNIKLATGTVKVFADTDAFWNSLVVGDVVNYKNRLVQYKGNNDTIYSCPVVPVDPTYVWTKTGPYCMLNDLSPVGYSGMLGYATRTRTGGSPSPYVEANLPNSGLGPYFPPILDTTTCPLPVPVIGWSGVDPACVKSAGGSQCPVGWTLSSDGTYCYQIDQYPAANTTSPAAAINLAHFQLSVYGEAGTVVHKLGGFNADGTWPTGTPALWPNIYAPIANQPRYPYATVVDYTTGLWINAPSDTAHGRLNSAGIWKQGNQSYTGTLGFARQVNIPTAGTYYIGVGSDDYGTIKIDGVTIVTQSVANISGANYLNGPSLDTLFKHWILYPVQLTAGPHIFELISTNSGAQGILGMEIYKGTESELIALSTLTTANYLFSTKDLIDGDPFDIGNYNCNAHPGYQLVNDAGVYYCRKITTQAPTLGNMNTGMKGYTNRARMTDGVLDGYTETNSIFGGLGTYVPPVTDLTACPITSPAASPVSTIISGTVQKYCSDRNCSIEGHVELMFVFDSPVPIDLVLYIGQLMTMFDGSKTYTGNLIFTPPAGATASLQYYQAGTQTPFEINIPAGSTSIAIPEIIYQSLYFGINFADWRCNNCQYPISDLYFKLALPTSGYTLALRSASSPGIIIHNIN
jgi:hypothetical protein